MGQSEQCKPRCLAGEFLDVSERRTPADETYALGDIPREGEKFLMKPGDGDVAFGNALERFDRFLTSEGPLRDYEKQVRPKHDQHDRGEQL